jgi:hypothetical protein
MSLVCVSEVRNTSARTIHGFQSPNVISNDELHSSLFVYFRISAPFADDHVIVSHATYVT